MKFDKEVDRILSECVIKEGMFDFIGGAIKSIGNKYLDAIKQAVPITSGAISAGMEAVKAKKEKVSNIQDVARNFLIYRFQMNPKKRIKIYGTSYKIEDLTNSLQNKIKIPKIGDNGITNSKDYMKAKKNYDDLKKAASLIKNKNLNELQLTNNSSLQNEIEKYLEELKQLHFSKGNIKESFILEKKKQKKKQKKNQNSNLNIKEKDKAEIDMGKFYDNISPNDVLTSLKTVIKYPFSYKDNNPKFIQQKLQYLFALVNDGQVIR